MSATEQSTIRIGTRGSALAMWQARFLQSELARYDLASELVIIKTRGDQIQHLSFDKIEGKGFFTKELEDALLDGSVDVAVHSMKDMPTEQPPGLCLTAVSYRANPADMLLIRPDAVDNGQPLRLKTGASVGTSAARRKALALDLQPGLTTVDIRGNVPTRLEKLRDGACDALFLAAAGLERLQLDVSDLVVRPLEPREFVPAPAQGVLAYQTLSAHVGLRRLLKQIHRSEVVSCTNVERQVLKLMGGGCHLPLGVYCYRDSNNFYHVHAAYAPHLDAPVVRVRQSSATTFQLADEIAGQLHQLANV